MVRQTGFEPATQKYQMMKYVLIDPDNVQTVLELNQLVPKNVNRL